MDSNLESSEKSSNGMLINAFGLFHIIKVHWLFALVTATSVSLIFTIILFMQESIYSAEANLVIDISADAVVGLNKVEEKMTTLTLLLYILNIEFRIALRESLKITKDNLFLPDDIIGVASASPL